MDTLGFFLWVIMKTAVTQTSIDSYHSHDFGDQAKEVLNAIRVLGETCIADIAGYLNIERSSVAARLNELKKANAIVFIGKRKSSRTDITSEFWRIREDGESVQVSKIQDRNVSDAARTLVAARLQKRNRFNSHPTLFGDLKSCRTKFQKLTLSNP